MKIKYAVSTMVFWWREDRLSLEQECELLRSMNFGVEIWPNIRGHNECRFERRNFQRLRSATEGMLVVMHGRNDVPSRVKWDEQLECAKYLDANIVTDIKSLRINENADWDFAGQILKAAQTSNIKISLSGADLDLLIEAGERYEWCGYCLDTGMANLDTKRSFKDYVSLLAPRTMHLHITDNFGQNDDHRPAGQGQITRKNWEFLLSAIEKTDNEIVGSLEMCPAAPPILIKQASDFLFENLKWPGYGKK